jgi:hypothetical protein
MGANNSMNKGKVMDASNRRTITKKIRKELVAHLRVEGSRPASANFSGTPPENSGGAENAAEKNSGTISKNFTCYMYELSLRHLVWAGEFTSRFVRVQRQTRVI